MSIRIWMLTTILALGLWPAIAHGQSSALRDATSRAHALRSEGQYQSALPFAKKALSLAEREFGPAHPFTATMLNNVGEIYRQLGVYAQAEPLHKRALAIREKVFGPRHPAVGGSLNNLASL